MTKPALGPAQKRSSLQKMDSTVRLLQPEEGLRNDIHMERVLLNGITYFRLIAKAAGFWVDAAGRLKMTHPRE